MPKFYKSVDGKKFYCDEKGELTKNDDGENVEVAADDTEAVDVESGVDEASKMLGEAMQKAIAEGDKVAAAKLEEAQKNVGAFLDAVSAQAKDKAPKVEVTGQKASFDVEAVQKSIERLQESKGSAVFRFKSDKELDALTKNTSRDDLTNDVLAPDRDTEIVREPQRSPFMEDIADTVSTDADYVEWIEVTNETGAPATTAELGTIPEKDYEFTAYRQPVEKITVSNKHSVELLKYGPELVAAIRAMLKTDLQLVTDAQLLSGNGTAPNLQGVLGVADELDATAVGTQRVADANLFDVLRIAATKIAVAGKGKFIPNYVVLNPEDTEKFDLTKNSDGDYIMPPFYDAAGRRVRGAQIIENTGITAGTFLIGDFNYLHVRPNGGVEVELTNSDGTDFTKDILTIKMRRFLAAYVKNNENGAFMTGDISDVTAALVAA